MLNNEFTCIIAKSPTNFRRTNLIEIDLPITCLPIATKAYTIPLKYKSFNDKEIKLLEDIYYWNFFSFTEHAFDCQRQAFKLSELFIRSEDNQRTMPLYGLLPRYSNPYKGIVVWLSSDLMKSLKACL